MPSFAYDVKNELSHLKPQHHCCRKTELYALLQVGASLTSGLNDDIGLTFSTTNAAVARRVLHLLKSDNLPYETKVDVKRTTHLHKHNNYRLNILPSKTTSLLLDQPELLTGQWNAVLEKIPLLLRKNCCLIAYLRGCFLAGGSINKPEASSHLELKVETKNQAKHLCRLLRRLSLPANINARKDAYAIYIKNSDDIIDLLSMMGAEKSVEKLEIAKNIKEVRMQVNRLVNCETANLQRSVDAASRQIELISKLDLQTLPPELANTAKARLLYPDDSLSELAKKLHLSKSGLYSRLRQLQNLRKH